MKRAGAKASSVTLRAAASTITANALPVAGAFTMPQSRRLRNLKALLRKAAERTRDSRWRAIDRITPAEYANYLAAAGYDAT